MLTINVRELHVHVHGLDAPQMAEIKRSFHNLKETVMATSEAATAKLDALGTTLDKISGETTALVTEVRELKEAAQNAGVPDEIMAKIDAMVSKAESIDTQVDDIAPSPTPTPPAEG